MKKFNIIRYLKRWWPLIALMSILAGAFFMRYASNNQAYTAQAVIKYTYDAASEGLTPNGEPLDVSEIFSSTVVKEAIERLGYSVNVDTIRSGGTVTGITPADVQTRQDALAEKGEEVLFENTDKLFCIAVRCILSSKNFFCFFYINESGKVLQQITACLHFQCIDKKGCCVTQAKRAPFPLCIINLIQGTL